jgi:CubicO group peptidase (beta-lactamase class C family)
MLNRRNAITIIGGTITGIAIAARPKNLYSQTNLNNRFDNYLEQARIDWRVPGLGVAIVQNNEIIYAKGFGITDTANPRKVDENTIFGIGSTTKAITAASIGILVDKNKLNWETPVKEYLPNFKIGNGEDYASLNLSDMMSHRTGMARHELLWYNNKNLSREKLLSIIPYLETFAPLRAKYQYNNLMVMLAGHVVEKTANKPWEEFVQANIFNPLGMKRTSAFIDILSHEKNSARGHRLDENKTAYSIPLRPEDRIGPAGSVNTSVLDFAQWVKLLLARGTFDNKQIYSNTQANKMWEPLISAGNGSYGCGWRIDNYRGLTRIAHGGNLNGFSSRVVLLPEKNIGIVIFSNLGGTGIQNYISLDLLDDLLGLSSSNWSVNEITKRRAAEKNIAPPNNINNTPKTETSKELIEYSGQYFHKAYGDFFVTFSDDKLKAYYNDMPMLLEHWDNDIFNAINERSEDFDLKNLKFTFSLDNSNKIVSVSAKMDDSTSPIIFTKL